MSTSASIALKFSNGRVRAITVQGDGYVEHQGVGNTLLQFYMDPKRVEALLDLGDCSRLCERLKPTADTPHTFTERQDGVTYFYGRDEKREDSQAVTYRSVDEWKSKGLEQFNYLMIPGKPRATWQWFAMGRDTTALNPLTKATVRAEERRRARLVAAADRKQAREEAKRAARAQAATTRSIARRLLSVGNGTAFGSTTYNDYRNA